MEKRVQHRGDETDSASDDAGARSLSKNIIRCVANLLS